MMFIFADAPAHPAAESGVANLNFVSLFVPGPTGTQCSYSAGAPRFDRLGRL